MERLLKKVISHGYCKLKVGIGASKSNTSSAKRNHEKQSGGKENAEESAEKYGLRNKKVKSYAE